VAAANQIDLLIELKEKMSASQEGESTADHARLRLYWDELRGDRIDLESITGTDSIGQYLKETHQLPLFSREAEQHVARSFSESESVLRNNPAGPGLRSARVRFESLDRIVLDRMGHIQTLAR
jgi:hypothetical protein